MLNCQRVSELHGFVNGGTKALSEVVRDEFFKRLSSRFDIGCREMYATLEAPILAGLSSIRASSDRSFSFFDWD